MKKNLNRLIEAMAGIPTVDERIQSRANAEPDAEVSAEPSAPRTGMGVATHAAKLQAKIDNLEARLQSAIESNAAVFIEVALIDPNPWQPRQFFDETELQSLAASIKSYGVLSPVAVREHPLEAGRYQLIAGERRTRSVRLLGLETIPAVVLKMSDAEMGAQALAENIVRADLSDYEVGMALAKLRDAFPTKLEMAESFGIKRTALYRYLAFEHLPAYVHARLQQTPTLLPAYAALDLDKRLKDSTKPPLAQEQVLSLLDAMEKGAVEKTDMVSALDRNSKEKANAVAFTGSQLRTPESNRVKSLVTFNGKRIGVITKDASNYAIRFKRSALSADQESQIATLLAKLFTVNDP